VLGIKLWDEVEYFCLLLSTVYYFVFASSKSLSDLIVGYDNQNTKLIWLQLLPARHVSSLRLLLIVRYKIT